MTHPSTNISAALNLFSYDKTPLIMKLITINAMMIATPTMRDLQSKASESLSATPTTNAQPQNHAISHAVMAFIKDCIASPRCPTPPPSHMIFMNWRRLVASVLETYDDELQAVLVWQGKLCGQIIEKSARNFFL